MRKIIIISITLLSILGAGSCTNNEGESEFDTVKPDLPKDSKEGIPRDSVQINTVDIPKP